MNKILLALTLLMTGHFVSAAEKTPKMIGTGPIRVVCTDVDGNKTIYNVNSVSFGGNSQKDLFVNGYCSGAGCEGVDEVSGDCTMTPNPDFTEN